MKHFPRIMATGVAATVALATLAACSPAAEVPIDRDLVIGAGAIVPGFDPLNGGHRTFLPTMPVYEPLLMWNQTDNTFDPWLAEEYSMSEDRRTLTMTLRDDVDFTDGVHMDAAGMEEFWDAMIESPGWAYSSVAAEQFGIEVTATGEYTLEFTTTGAMTQPFFNILAKTEIASPEAIKDPESLAIAPVGTGPYVLDELIPDVSLSFTPNPDYWNPDIQYWDSVKIVIFADNIAALNALKSGQIDATAVNLANAAEAEASGFTLHFGQGQFGTLGIVDTDGSVVPALGDVRVRRAMNMAFDRETIAETLDYGYGIVSSQPFAPNSLGYVEGGDDRYPFDLEAARDLMAEAGYADGFDLVIPVFNAEVFESSPSLEPIVQQSLADIGIRVTFEVFADFAEYYFAIRDETYAVALMKQYNANTLGYFDAGSYYQHMPDAEGGELVRLIQQGTIEEAQAAEVELGEYVLDQAWWVPFSRAPTIWASTPEIDIVVGDVSANPEFWEFSPAAQ